MDKNDLAFISAHYNFLESAHALKLEYEDFIAGESSILDTIIRVETEKILNKIESLIIDETNG